MTLLLSYDAFSNDPFVLWLAGQNADFSGLLQGNEELVSQFLEEAQAFCNENWGDRRLKGIMYLTAHLMLDLVQPQLVPGFISGQITSLSVSQGSNSTSWSAANTNPRLEQLALTLPGQQYLRLRERVPVSGFVV